MNKVLRIEVSLYEKILKCRVGQLQCVESSEQWGGQEGFMGGLAFHLGFEGYIKFSNVEKAKDPPGRNHHCPRLKVRK